MTPLNFCYWLQGKFEGRTGELEQTEIDEIENHIQLVFTKVTPETASPGTITEIPVGKNIFDLSQEEITEIFRREAFKENEVLDFTSVGTGINDRPSIYC